MRRSPSSWLSYPAAVISFLALITLTLTASPSAVAPPEVNPAVPRFETVGRINQMVLQTDGKIVIAGSFSHVNGIANPNIARLNDDGTVDSTFAASGTLLSSIRSLALQPDGKILIGSDIYSSNFALRRLNANGQLDASFKPDSGYTSVSILRVQPDGRSVIYFLHQTGLRGLRRLNADGTVEPTFHESEFANKVIIVQPDGKLVGYNPQGGGLSRLNADGTLDSTFHPEPDVAGSIVQNVVVQPDNKILVTAISFSGGIHGVYERLTSTGARDPTFTPASDAGSPAIVQEDGKILTNGGTKRLNSDGSVDLSYTSNTQLEGRGARTQYALPAGGGVILASDFVEVNGVRCTACVRLNSDGTVRGSFLPLITQPARVLAVMAQSNNKIVVGGDFVRVDGQSAAGLTRLNADLSLDSSFQQNAFVNPNVRFLRTQSTGKILAFSPTGFVRTGAEKKSGLLRFSQDGSFDSTFTPDPGVTPDEGLDVQANDQIIFSGFDGNATLGRLNSDGTLDSTFDSSHANTRGPVAVDKVDRIITSRALPTGPPILGLSEIRISRYQADGTFDSDFASAHINGQGPPTALTIAPDNKILMGGFWSTVDDIEQPYCARLLSEGALDTTFKPMINDVVWTITAELGGKMVIGGAFTAVDGVPVRGVARLNIDGTLDPSLNNIDTQGGTVYTSTKLPNGQIVVGGEFGIATSIITPGPGQTLSVGTSAPFATLVIASSIQDVKQVRFLVKGGSDSEFVLVDTQTIPLATNGFIGPGYAENSGSPGFDSAVYGSDMFIPPQVGTYQLKVEVLDSAGIVVSSTITTVTAVDPNQSPPPETFGIGDLATGTVLVANNSVTITAGPQTQGSGLSKLELLVNGTVAQQIQVGAEFSARASSSITFDATTGNYTFIFTPRAPGTFGLNIRATAGNGVTTTSNTIAVTAGPSSRLLNISTRMFVDSGDNVLIGGTIVTGTGQKKVLIRAIGPSLANAGVAGALPDPTLELRNGDGALLASNDDWGDSSDKQAIIDTTIPPSNPKESAILATLPVSTTGTAYTAIVRGANGTTGIGLVEVYDLDGNVSSSKLANIATRGKVLTGDNAMIGGFILGGGLGAAPNKVIVRAIGPSLPFAGALPDPILELHQGPTTIATNDDWKENEVEVQATTIPPSNDRESAIVRTLQPLANSISSATISTTAIVRGKSDTTGIALVEVYDLGK